MPSVVAQLLEMKFPLSPSPSLSPPLPLSLKGEDLKERAALLKKYPSPPPGVDLGVDQLPIGKDFLPFSFSEGQTSIL
jgi:hypothetical protein